MADINTFTLLLNNLLDQPVLALFLVLGMGYLIGGIRIGSFSFGLVAGVLFAGLFLGILIFVFLRVPRQLVLRYTFSL